MMVGFVIPGENLLNMASRIIYYQTITYYQFVSRAPNVVGQDIVTYASPITLVGSLQPVPRNLYEQYGLDLQKDYVTFYTSNDLLDITRDVSGDQIVYGNRRYQVESSNDWFRQDGWKGVLCIDLGADNG